LDASLPRASRIAKPRGQSDARQIRGTPQTQGGGFRKSRQNSTPRHACLAQDLSEWSAHLWEETTMKTYLLSAALILSAGMAFAADAVEGTWKTTPDDNGNFGHIQIKPCGDAFCGTLVKSFGSDGKEMKSDNVGKRIIWDMKAKGGGAYGDGKIWSPDRDKTYNSKMTLTGDTLAVKGCVLMICRDGGKWTKLK
jgi:uncharacterized protein (DUF2147 family)